MKCKNCGWSETTRKPQKFKDGSLHIREECAKCGSYVRWHKQGAKSFRQQAFELVRDLSNCTTNQQFIILKAQAIQLMQLVARQNEERANDPEQMEMQA